RHTRLLRGNRPHRDQTLAKTSAAQPMTRERFVELLLGDQLALEEDVAEALTRAQTCALRTISRASSPRRRGENGLVMWADAPMPSLSSRYVGATFPVIMITGMLAVAAWPRRRATAV